MRRSAVRGANASVAGVTTTAVAIVSGMAALGPADIGPRCGGSVR